MTRGGANFFDELAKRLASRFSVLPSVEAVAVAGSRSTGHADSQSDMDVYVYTHAEISVIDRTRIAAERASRVEIDSQGAEPGDGWVEADTGVCVDVMFRGVEWIEERIDLVLRRHVASAGYSTCFWHNVLCARAFYDRTGWFYGLQRRANQPYPEELRWAIINKNYPLLRRNIFSFVRQLELAVIREDLVSINHRVAALLASYFDILFAVNYLPHPGEKRLVAIAEKSCRKVPEGMREQVNRLVHSASQARGKIIEDANMLIDNLEKFLNEEIRLCGAGATI